MKQTIENLADHFLNGGFFLEEAVEILERTLITRALERTSGNRSAASKLLGIHRNTLQRKLLDFKVERKPVQRASPRVGRAGTGS